MVPALRGRVPEPVDVADFVDHVGLHGRADRDRPRRPELRLRRRRRESTGWNDASQTFNVTLELVRRGYTEEEIGMIWSGNLLRVLDEVQAVAAEIQAGG